MAYAAYKAAVLADTPSAFWECLEAAGELADSSGNARPSNGGTLGFTYQQASLIAGGGFTIRATAVKNCASRISNVGFALSNNFALEIFTSPAAGPGTDQVIIGAGTPFQNGDGYALIIDAGTGKFRVYNGNTGVTTCVSDAAAVAGNVYHLVATRDAGTWKMYVNGVLQAATSAVAPTAPAINGGCIFNDGQVAGGVATFCQYLGYSQCAAWYGAAMSAATALAHYNAAVGAVPGATDDRRRRR